MIDAKKLLDQFMGTQIPGAQGDLRSQIGNAMQMAQNNPWKTAGLAGLLFNTGMGKGLVEKAVKVGGMAAIARLGYLAYQNYQSGKAPSPSAQLDPQQLEAPPAHSGFQTETAPASNDFALILVRAMIAASRADGHIDESERQRILGKVQEGQFGSEVEAFLNHELSAPTDLDALIAAAQTEEQRVEIYTASRLAIEPDSRAERGYLDLLAGRLGLADALVDHIEATIASAKISL